MCETDFSLSLYSNPKGQVPTKWKIAIRPSLDLKLKPFFSGIFVKSLAVTCVSLNSFVRENTKGPFPFLQRRDISKSTGNTTAPTSWDFGGKVWILTCSTVLLEDHQH